MNRERVIVIGAGGHACVVADALLAAGVDVIGFTDADARRHGSEVCGRPVLGGDAALARHDRSDVQLANGLGSLGNDPAPLRRRVQQALEADGWHFCSVVHPTATVSPFAQLGAGVQILAGAIVQPRARLCDGAIVNTRAVVEHDVHIGAWTHVAPGAVVCGDAVIGACSHVGAGAVVRQGVSLGEQTLLGIGAAAAADFSGTGTLVGVPAKPMKAKQ